MKILKNVAIGIAIILGAILAMVLWPITLAVIAFYVVRILVNMYDRIENLEKTMDGKRED